MRNETVIVNVIFDAARGDVSINSREATVGMPLGTLPRPTRAGYSFEGWYLDGLPVTEDTVLTAEEDIRLVARWARKKGNKTNSMLKKQKVAVTVLSIVAVVLALTLVFVHQLVSIYGMVDTYYDENGVEYTEKYYIRKKDGEYAMFDRRGNKLEQNSEGYYLANSGNQYSVDPETGAYELYAVVDYDSAGGEVLGFSDRIMLFPQITQSNMQSIKVTNEHGTYEFYRDENGTVKIKGFEDSIMSYDQTLFASLCVSCGYTLSMQKLDLSPENANAPRLEDGSIDYSAYGLADLYDGEGTLTYTPARYVITGKHLKDVNGDGKIGATEFVTAEYTVKVGDAILSKGGYYIQFEKGVLTADGYSSELGARAGVYIVSADIASTVLQPVEAMVTPMIVSPTNVNTYPMVNNFILGTLSFDGSLENIEDIEIDPIVAFTYQDLESRMNSIYSSRPYICQTELMKGYEIDSDNASGALGLIHEMQFVACRKLGLTKEALREYGLDGEVYYLYYESPVLDENNSIAGYIENTVIIGEKTENGTYYAASFLTDMIVEIDQYYLAFLQWEVNDWYDNTIFQQNIAHITDMTFQVGDKKYEFTLDNSASYMYYEASDGTMKVIDLSKGTLKRNSDGSATYIDQNGTSHKVQSFDFNKGDFYIRIFGPQETVAYEPFQKFLITSDRNGLTVLRVYSNVGAENETYHDYALTETVDDKVKQVLSYRVIYRDANGDEFDVIGTYTGSDSKTYKDYLRLTYWQELYNETEKKYYWDRSEPVAGSLILRDSAGKEYSISLGSNNLDVFCEQYNGKNGSKLDYTIVHTYTTDSGTEKTETISAVDNFRKLYSLFMYYSIEGDANPKEFEKNLGMSIKEYIAKGDDVCQAIFTYHVKDQSKIMNLDTGLSKAEDKAPEIKVCTEANEMDVVIRLYRYSERKSLITIEVIEKYDENGNPISDPTNVEGSFYVLSSYADLIVEAAERLVNEERVATD